MSDGKDGLLLLFTELRVFGHEMDRYCYCSTQQNWSQTHEGGKKLR